jgi:hypothetical protein
VRVTPINNKNQSTELSFVTKNEESSSVPVQWSAVLNADSTHLIEMLSDIYRARNDYVFTRIIRPLDPAMSHWN